MGAGVVTVGRRAYAVGLYWENSPEGRVSQTAKEAASQPGQQAEFYAVRPANKEGRVPQFGLGQAAAGHKTAMPSFAACLANQQPGSWAGAFRIRGTTAVVVVRDDLIVPDGDMLFTEEAEARDRLLQEMSFGGLQKIYAPENWSIPGSDTMPLTLLMNERHDVILRPTRIPQKLLIIAGSVVALFIIILGVTWYVRDQREQEEIIRFEREAAIKRAQDLVTKALPGSQGIPQYPPPVRVWENHPQPLEYLEACRQALSKMPLVAAGWIMNSLRCTGKSLDSTWRRDQGITIAPEGFTVDDMGKNAVYTVKIPDIAPRGPEELVSTSDITYRYLVQNWSARVDKAPDDPPPPPPPGYSGTWAPPPPPWVKRSFTVNVTELPSDLPLQWTGVPGIVVNSLSFSGNSLGGTWTVEGVIYENRN